MGKWRAEKGQTYYTVNTLGLYIGTPIDCNNLDEERFKSGNYFATREEAEKALEIIKSALVGSEVKETVKDILKRVDKMAEEFVGDWEDTNILKWFIDYSLNEKKWDCNYDFEYKGYGTKYITDNKEVIDKIVEELNKAQEREGK